MLRADVHASMSGMFKLADVFEFVVDRFDHRTFTQQHFVLQGHEAVFHISPNVGKQMDTPIEQHFEEFMGDIPFVSEKLPEYIFFILSITNWLWSSTLALVKAKLRSSP